MLNPANSSVTIIVVSRTYSAVTSDQRKKNLNALNEAAARIFEACHVPIVGVNVALWVVDKSEVINK